MPLTSLVRFGDFELDAARYELRRGGRVLKIERIPMELLLLLVERRGEVVTRQEISDRLWGKDVFVDTEHGINTAIRKIRTVLRENRDTPRFIQTVQGKGYRFVESNLVLAAPESAGIDHQPPASAGASAESAAPRPRRSRLWGIGAALMAGLLTGVAALTANPELRDRVLGPRTPPRITSIAVLPLINLSGDQTQDYFADGLTDEFITALAKATPLRVVSRTSAMQYKNVRRPVAQIARELGVDAILEGSVQRQGQRVHLTVQLVRAEHEQHIWAESYDRSSIDALTLPEDLAATVAREVRIATTTRTPERPISPEAHDAFLRGRFLWFNDEYDQSQIYFEQAVQLQPDYAAAWAGLADSLIVRAVALELPPDAVRQRARAAAQRAIDLAPDRADVLNAMAAEEFFGDWDWQAADATSRRAIAVDPSFHEAFHLRSYILTALNRPAEALAAQRRATEIDPFARPWALGLALIRAHQFDAAVADLHLRLQGTMQVRTTHAILSDAYWASGRFELAVREWEAAMRLGGGAALADALHQAYVAGGAEGVCNWDVTRTLAAASRRYESPYSIATTYARCGRREPTLRALEAAFAEHTAVFGLVQAEPLFDFLHGEPRFRALVRNAGLPPAGR